MIFTLAEQWSCKGQLWGQVLSIKQMTASFQGHDTEDQKTRLGAKYISLHLALLP